MIVDAMMMMKSTATSRQPKSALRAASTPCTQSRIAKRAEAKHRVLALGGQRLTFADVLVDQRHHSGVAPGQGRDRDGCLAVGVELLGEHAARKRRARHPLQDLAGLYEVVACAGLADQPLPVPHGADEP